MSFIETYDIIVVGLGAHGSAALWQLSKTGKKIAGIDRYMPPHDKGSSHGESRIIRQAYHENPLYVPLVQAAYPLWQELSENAGKVIFQKTSGLLLGTKDAGVVSGARLSADTYNIPYDDLDAAAIRQRFPVFRPGADTVGILEHDAGILFPETAITSFLTTAAVRGAAIKTNERVVKITPMPGGIELETSKTRYRTEKLIVTAGAWLGSLFPELRLPLTIRRQVLFWLGGGAAQSPPFQKGKMPIFLWEYKKDKLFYGIPDPGNGIKLGWHHDGNPINPDQLTQHVEKEEIAAMQQLAADHLTIEPNFRKSCVCMYTNTPDEDFIIDLHPQHPGIVIASPCSGHGFKFSAIIGRLLTDLALDRPTGFDLTPFSIHRKTIAI